MLTEWLTTISFVFGGCCSNAVTLEQLTSQFPRAGSLITFCQFAIISIQGIRRHVTWSSYGPRLKPRRIPLMPYLIQVVLFYLVSLLNNAAFAYRIPMAVHIIFRSGGLVISMILGWIFAEKTYTTAQVLSVFIVTLGVIFTTLSASEPSSNAMIGSSTQVYLTGIGILTLALVFSGFLGLVQDYTYTKYGRPPNSSDKSFAAPTWQESMFYLHFLALPMFVTVRKDLMSQFYALSRGPLASYTIAVPPSISATILPSLSLPPPSATPLYPKSSSFLSFTNVGTSSTSSLVDPDALLLRLQLPAACFPLLLNTVTQLLCAVGVHRLTTQVSSLTVTLILVVRKAVSLILSIIVGWGRKANNPENVNMNMMWSGAALVLLGTIGYSLATNATTSTKKKSE
ncbi:MAG: UAA transporter [Lentinula lateritia]|uniref:UAA transporter n=1 Tax=Lentinula lateritia TaxID=40482 RepID=A0ABQ8VEP3_9AGAR|nr:MAG: UAA transporter [Lentinula lateritia]KAJ4491737.1 UAA transporter [Lentinula lateritia]